MHEYLLRCLLLLIPLITIASMQVNFLIDGAVVLGTPPLNGRMQFAGR
jgi:ABC-type microcin C transport system permease subunit YejB